MEIIEPRSLTNSWHHKIINLLPNSSFKNYTLSIGLYAMYLLKSNTVKTFLYHFNLYLISYKYCIFHHIFFFFKITVF